MKREIIFEVPNKTYGNYRVVCQFGYDDFFYDKWCGYLEKEKTVKCWPWSKKKKVWEEIDECCWNVNFNTMEELKETAMNFYDEKIEKLQRIIQKAMSLK